VYHARDKILGSEEVLAQMQLYGASEGLDLSGLGGGGGLEGGGEGAGEGAGKGKAASKSPARKTKTKAS
jgi:hypothetical protein